MNNTSKPVLEMNEMTETEKCLDSPIPQLDRDMNKLDVNENKVIYSFKSEYAEEDIEYTLEEIFQDTVVTSSAIVSREKVKPRSAECKYTIELILDPQKRTSFSWPRMNSLQQDVIQKL